MNLAEKKNREQARKIEQAKRACKKGVTIKDLDKMTHMSDLFILDRSISKKAAKECRQRFLRSVY